MEPPLLTLDRDDYHDHDHHHDHNNNAVETLPNTPAPTPLSTSTNSLRPPAQAVRSRRHRSRFDEVRRSETAATRKEGACEKCRKSGTRCHQSHRQGLISPSTPSPSSHNNNNNNNNAASPVAIAAFPPARHHGNYQPDNSIHRFMEDPNNSQRLIEHFAPRHFDIGAGGRLRPAGGFGAFGAGYGSQSVNSFVPTRPQTQLPSNSYSSSQDTIQPRLPHTQSVPGPRSFLPGAVATGQPSPLSATNKVVKQRYPPSARRQYRGQSQNIWPRPPSVVSLPPQFEGLTQISEPIYDLRNTFPPPHIAGHPLPGNPFQVSHAGSQFEPLGSMNSNEPPSATYDQLSNPALSTFSTPMRQGYDNTSSFRLNPGLQAQAFEDQFAMYSQEGSLSRNMQQSLPRSYPQTFLHDHTFGIPPTSSSQAHGYSALQSNLPPDDDLPFDPVLDFELSSMLSGRPYLESSTANSSHYNTLAPPAGSIQLPIRSAGNNEAPLGDYDHYLYSVDRFGDEFDMI